MFLWCSIVAGYSGKEKGKKKIFVEETNVERRMDEYHGKKKYYVVVWNVLRDFRMIKYVG